MMSGHKKLPVRLMMRAEGEWWNAYFGESPQSALLLGKIRLSVVSRSEPAKHAFMSLMSDVVKLAIEDITGQSPTMDVTPAPEHERSGSA